MAALTTSHWIPDGSGPPLLEGATVGSRLREVAAEVPDRVALVEGVTTPERRQWTYAQLLADAERCARLLLQYFEPGERVAVWAHNLPEWVLLEYGAALAGLALFTGATWARAIGIFFAVLSATANFFFIPFYPFWSLLEIAMAVFVIWALAVWRPNREGTRIAPDDTGELRGTARMR